MDHIIKNKAVPFLPPVSVVNRDCLIAKHDKALKVINKMIFNRKSYQLTDADVKELQKAGNECRDRIKFYKTFYKNAA